MSYISDIRAKVGHDPIFMPAAACAIIKDGKILFQKRVDNGKWALHGGSLEFHETFLDAMEREVKEELGIKVKNPVLVGTYSGENLHFIYPNKDEVYVVAAVYLVTDYENDFSIDPNEVSEIKWFPIDDLPLDDIHKPDICGITDAINHYLLYN